MGVFVDTGIFVALRNADDELHERSKSLMKSALKSEFGRAYTSDYVIDEAVTTALVRTKRHDFAVDLGKYILESPRIIKLRVDDTSFKEAWEKFKTLKDKTASFTDCTSLALMTKFGITQILSFDADFDGLVSRIC